MPCFASQGVNGFLGIDLSRAIGLVPTAPVVDEPLPAPTFHKTNLVTETHAKTLRKPIFSAGKGGKVPVQIGVDGKPGTFEMFSEFQPMISGALAAGASVVLTPSGDGSAGVLDNEHGLAVAGAEEAIC